MALKRTAIRCPHCGQPARIASSSQLSALVRESYYDCTDVVDCGHRFVATTSIDRTIVPSLQPRHGVNLPIVERRPNDIVVKHREEEAQPDNAHQPHHHNHPAPGHRPYANH